jgi:septum formation protein
MTARIVLASTSPTRRALLSQVGLSFVAEGAGVPEPLERFADPTEQARALAVSKARAVAARHPNDVVIGADQVLAFEGEVWGKSETADEARRLLRRLSGATHSLICGLAIIAPGTFIVDDDESRLTMHALRPDEIDGYIATNEWQGCAGGYQVEHRGLALFSKIEGDYTNILGLPMLKLLAHLRGFGISPLASPSVG